MDKIPFLDLAKISEMYAAELREAACRVIDSGRYLHGCETKQFELELAQSCGAEGAVAVSNGLDALRMILRAYIIMGELQPGDEVIVAANTYIASILAITDAGLKPVLVEPDSNTYNLDAEGVKKTVTGRTRAIMVVHLYGNPCWDKELKQTAMENNLLVVEDNAQAIGATASAGAISGDSRFTGGLGNAAAFSFYPTKNIGALGDAGAVTSSDFELLNTIRALSNYGSDKRYHNIYQGFNCRMDEMQAAMLRIKLKHLNEETTRRSRIAEIYNAEINHPDIIQPKVQANTKHVWHQYIVRCRERNRLQQHLAQAGIGTDIHYAVPPIVNPATKSCSADIPCP